MRICFENSVASTSGPITSYACSQFEPFSLEENKESDSVISISSKQETSNISGVMRLAGYLIALISVIFYSVGLPIYAHAGLISIMLLIWGSNG